MPSRCAPGVQLETHPKLHHRQPTESNSISGMSTRHHQAGTATIPQLKNQFSAYFGRDMSPNRSVNGNRAK